MAPPDALTRDERQDIYIITLASKAIERRRYARARAARATPDGATIVYSMLPIERRGHQSRRHHARPLFNSHLMLYDVATKKIRDASDPSFDNSAGAIVWAPDSKRILFGIGDRVYRSIAAYTPSTARYTKLTKGQMISFAGGALSKDGSTIAFTMDSTEAPADVYVAGADFQAPRKLTAVNPVAADFSLGETEVLTWKTADGWESEGILVKPVGYQPGKRYPLLVDVHGGPTGAHTNGFKVGVHNGGQLWAGRGWAVLYPNPRGSSNYGEKFMRGNVPDWGGGDYRDIMAGVDEVIKRGVADPEKLAVMGWSYGGYMTRSSRRRPGSRRRDTPAVEHLQHTHDRHRATSARSTISDEKTLKLYAERSGLTYAGKVTTPLLIMHGQNDERVPIGQPMEFYRAEGSRKIVELVGTPREGHSNSEHYQRDRCAASLSG